MTVGSLMDKIIGMEISELIESEDPIKSEDPRFIEIILWDVVITDVFVSDDKEELRLITDRGYYNFVTDADCCSKAWIEHLEGKENIIGKKVIDIEQFPPVTLHEDGDEYGCLQSYITVFRSKEGTMEVECRNESNGYYGGSWALLVYNGFIRGEMG